MPITKKIIFSNKTNGFFLIEVVVAASVITVVLMFLLGSIQDSVDASKRSLERTQASFLLEEGAEAVKAVRDNGWSTNITPLQNGTTYYLAWSGSAWSLTTDPTASYAEGAFTRMVVFSPVYRDDQDDVATSGTLDDGSRKVQIMVSWPTNKAIKNEKLEFLIADIH